MLGKGRRGPRLYSQEAQLYLCVLKGKAEGGGGEGGEAANNCSWLVLIVPESLVFAGANRGTEALLC